MYELTAPDRKEPTASKKRSKKARSYPIHTLEEAAYIPTAIYETNAGLPFNRVLLAKSLGTTPASSGFTQKLNSSAKYGLTKGGYNDERISITPLGTSIVAPKNEDERHKALVNAALQPDIFGRFYKILDGKRFPDDIYVKNMLQQDFDISELLTDECLKTLKYNGAYAGLFVQLGEHLYVTLTGQQEFDDVFTAGPSVLHNKKSIQIDIDQNGSTAEDISPKTESVTRIFIGHTGEQEITEYLKDILDEFEIPYEITEIILEETEPVSTEVSDSMRKCSSAVLIFGNPTAHDQADQTNTKMLFHLGAASLMFGDKVINLEESNRDSSNKPSSVPNGLPFQRDRLGDLGITVLRELHRMGIIKVQVMSV